MQTLEVETTDQPVVVYYKKGLPLGKVGWAPPSKRRRMTVTRFFEILEGEDEDTGTRQYLYFSGYLEDYFPDFKVMFSQPA